VAQWLQRFAAQHGGFDVELVDLAEVGLPLLDVPNHPRLRQYTQQHTRDWSATVSRADAQFLTDDDEFVPHAGLEAGAKGMLDELLRLTPVLARLRTAA
jgi:hypothetical protein